MNGALSISTTVPPIHHELYALGRHLVVGIHTEFNDTNIGLVSRLIDRHFGYSFNPILNCVCDMRNTASHLEQIRPRTVDGTYT
jgi:hypothetical protein